jgi:hypothetical protein
MRLARLIRRALNQHFRRFQTPCTDNLIGGTEDLLSALSGMIGIRTASPMQPILQITATEIRSFKA